MPDPTTTTKDFETLISEATARDSNIVPAVVLSAITATGHEFYSRTSGYNGISPDAPPVRKDATFWLASCTKLAASIAALQCVERGLITLDEPVGTHLPELRDAKIATLGEGGEAVLAPAGKKITLRHLLTHTSGLVYEWGRPQLEAWRKANGTNSQSFSGTVTKLYDLPLVFEPGEGWGYGPSIDWAGVLVERLNGGVTLGDYMQKEIFGRLGGEAGKSTTFRLDSAAAKEAKIKERLLPNVERGADGKLVQKPWGFSEEVQEDSGGAGWYSSVADYMAILQDLLAPEPKVLQKANVEEWLYKGHITNKNALDQLVHSRTGMTPQEGDDVDGWPINYALGGLLWVKDGDVLPKGTLTWGGLPNLKWFANREKGVAAMYASQVTPPSDPQSQELAAKFFQEIWRIHNGSK